MNAPSDRKVVLVTRRTRLEELVAKYHTLAQARFYLDHLGADFSDYLKENAAYAQSLQITADTLQAWGRYQIIDRAYLTNMVFGSDDIVVALGQDGLVANTMKYLNGQPLIGLNPEPSRWDGVLLPFRPNELQTLLMDVAGGRCATKAITMAEVRLSDGQVLRAVNDVFIGPKTHTSALYDIAIGDRSEVQSSSGIVVSTGLGSTAWLKSIVTGSISIANAMRPAGKPADYQARPWDSPNLTFAVREPFPSKSSAASLVFGNVTAQQPLNLRSRMPENGIIFSDGMETDFIRFTAGLEATISIASERGRLAV